MRSARFAKSVPVFVGLGFPAEIETVWEAYELLNDWSHRGPLHSSALAICRAGLTGEANEETVRDAFEVFARKAGILAPDALERAASEHALAWRPV